MKTRYLKLTIGGQQVDVTNAEDLPIAINYSLEDPDNFQKKTASNAVGIVVPATLQNDKVANQFYSPDSYDTTPNQSTRSNQQCVIEANGLQILTGKAFLDTGGHNVRPTNYKYNLYGDNADWLIDLQEKTFYDYLKQLSFSFDKATIEASWLYDGTSEALPYVFAPIKYRQPMGAYALDDNGNSKPVDDNYEALYMRPCLSVYWILYWGLKSVGYKLQSTFMDTAYFRRLVMPWTWGNFIDSDGTRLNAHKFLAKSTEKIRYNATNGRVSAIWDLKVSNDSTDGAFDANQEYTYNNSTFAMEWQYKPPHYGPLEAHLTMTVDYRAFVNQNSDMELRVQWYHNGVQVDGGYGMYTANGNLIMSLASNAGIAAGREDANVVDVFATIVVEPNDTITAKIYRSSFQSKLGNAYIEAQILEYKLSYFRIPLGGTINFANFTGFQKVKWEDLLRGVVDGFNISMNTDSISKVVYMEPTHPYSLTNNMAAVQNGFFKNDFISWQDKLDLSKDWEMQNFSEYEREVSFTFKEDANDGILKKIQDRFITTVAAGKYIFPERFKKGKKAIPNRFFSAVMHYEADQWKSITGVAPQLICMIPENISNTSNTESNNTFQPKLAYYKGLTSGVGGWKWDGEEKTNLPFCFAVNYKAGGESDPILSYSDENIAGTWGKGLLRRFFLQRLAILRNGQVYTTYFRLNDTDVCSLHREYIAFNGHKYELVQIKDYKPLQEASTGCVVRRWAPVEQKDSDNVFPSQSNVVSGTATGDFDTKYAPLKCLANDIPQ